MKSRCSPVSPLGEARRPAPGQLLLGLVPARVLRVHELTKAGWKPVGDKHASFDNEILAALEATLRTDGSESARTRDVLAHLGEHDAPVGRKLKVAQALARMVVRSGSGSRAAIQARAVRPYGR